MKAGILSKDRTDPWSNFFNAHRLLRRIEDQAITIEMDVTRQIGLNDRGIVAQ